MRKKQILIKCCAAVWWLGAAAWCPGQVNFTQGETLLMQNKPKEAVIYLENAIADEPANAKAYLYLGLVYEQLNRTDEAIAAYRKILDRAGDLNAQVANNLGNAYFKKGNTADAEQSYSKAINADAACASAYLGRANTRVQAGSLKTAIDDYELYLLLEPGSSKRSGVERLLAVIRSEIAAGERRKLLAEEAARAEAERRKRLLEEVSASLQSAADASQGLSSGAEEVEGYAGEFELDE